MRDEASPRGRIEAYLGGGEQSSEQRDELVAVAEDGSEQAVREPPSPAAEAAVHRALDFLASCVGLYPATRPPEAPAEPTEAPAEPTEAPAEPTEAAPLALTMLGPASLEAMYEPWPPTRERHALRVLSTARIPRGVLYWLVLGAAGSWAWRSWSSLYAVAVAALAASAAVIGLEIVLRRIDPRIARRLGLGRPLGGLAFYAASALLAAVTGIGVAYAF